MSYKDKKLQCYLAGKMSGLSLNEMNEWRIQAKHELLSTANVQDYRLLVINPVEYYNFENAVQQSEEEIEDFDLSLVLKSDFIIVNLKGLDSSTGTQIELHDANYNHKIPIFAIGSKSVYDDLHPWIKRCITRRENTIHELCDYLQHFYFIK